MLSKLLYAFECMTEEMLDGDREALELDQTNKLVERNWELGGKKGRKPKPVKKLPAARTAAPAPKAAAPAPKAAASTPKVAAPAPKGCKVKEVQEPGRKQPARKRCVR
jgi:hypothetical protein